MIKEQETHLILHAHDHDDDDDDDDDDDGDDDDDDDVKDLFKHTYKIRLYLSKFLLQISRIFIARITTMRLHTAFPIEAMLCGSYSKVRNFCYG
jgi:ABC-type Zn2+ transport system substrate-binding protein/surface adhesin